MTSDLNLIDIIKMYKIQYQGEIHHVLARDPFEAHHLAKAVLGIRDKVLPDEIWDCLELVPTPSNAPSGVVGLWLEA